MTGRVTLSLDYPRTLKTINLSRPRNWPPCVYSRIVIFVIMALSYLILLLSLNLIIISALQEMQKRVRQVNLGRFVNLRLTDLG